MKISYTDHFVLPLPEGRALWARLPPRLLRDAVSAGHRFPMQKYSLLRQRVMRAGLSGGEALREPQAATDEEILRAHDADYLRRVVGGGLMPAEVRQIGSADGRAFAALSRRDHRSLPRRAGGAGGGSSPADRPVLDCDVHQGNGTASILANDPTVFTFSIHSARNFPFRKETSDLDIELPDGTGDVARQRRADAAARGASYFRFCRVSSHRAVNKVRPGILNSKYRNFLTGLVRLLELVLMHGLGTTCSGFI
jgi:hypothetical protein